MNSDIKLRARFAVSGAFFRLAPYVFLSAAGLAFFSVFNAAINGIFPFANSLLLALTAFVSVFFYAFFSAFVSLILQIKFLLFARGIKVFSVHGISLRSAFSAFFLRLRLFFTKLFCLAAFEALPVAFSLLLTAYCGKNPFSLRAFYALSSGIFLLFVTGLIFYFVFIQRYSRAEFYLACYENFTPRDAVCESIRKTEGKLCETLIFKLSFLPWFLLCLAVFPAFFVIPYYKQSLTCRYLDR